MSNAMFKFAISNIFCTISWLLILRKLSLAMEVEEYFQNIIFRIVGGVPVDIDQFPYQVAVMKGEQLHCGGSIISRQFILTAAHCTYDHPHNILTVRVGSSHWNKEGELLNVVAKFEHPYYINPIYHNDIAILKLGRLLVYSDTVQPVKLPEANAPPPPQGTLATVSGWGKLDFNSQRLSYQLMAVNVPILSRESCEESYRTSIVSKSMICAGYLEGGRDACSGDSGGPMTINGTQYGIVSWGVSCAAYDSPGVYASVIELRNFISETIADGI